MNPSDPAKNPHAEMMQSLAPLGRYAHVDEIVGAVAYLASPIADYVTGQELTVDGGLIA